MPATETPAKKVETKKKESDDKDSVSDEASKSWCLAAEYT